MLASETIRMDRSEVLDTAVVLGDVDDAYSLSVLKLSCGKCQEELREALDGDGLRFFLVSESWEERLASQLLLAVAAHGDPGRRSERLSEVFELFLSDADGYLRDLDSWRLLCEELSGGLSARSKAMALNRLDRQAGLLGLLAISRAPVALDLKSGEIPLRGSRYAGDSLFRLRDRTVSLSYLYPNFKDASEVEVQRLELDPLHPLPLEVWRYLSERRKGGFAWHWVGDLAQWEGSRFLRWQASLLGLGSDEARRKAFESLLEAAEKEAAAKEVSTEKMLERLGWGEEAVDPALLDEMNRRLRYMALNRELTID